MLGLRRRFAIDPALRLGADVQFHLKTRNGSVFHAAIADTEPDGWGRRVILRVHAKRWQDARRAGTKVETWPLNAVEFLLLVVDDFSRVGALRFAGLGARHREPHQALASACF
jgi:serine/threonine-protein kinase HipA